jgi:hypothetical protein
MASKGIVIYHGPDVNWLIWSTKSWFQKSVFKNLSNCVKVQVNICVEGYIKSTIRLALHIVFVSDDIRQLLHFLVQRLHPGEERVGNDP